MERKIDILKNQKFLRLIYRIQNNDSNAINSVKRALDDMEVGNVRYINGVFYADAQKPNPIIMNGKKPKMFTEEQQEEIRKMFYIEKLPKTQIAKKMRCSEKTIRNYLK